MSRLSTECPCPSALRVATARALHQLIDMNNIFNDPFALGSLGSQKAAELLLDPDKYNDVPARSMRAGIVARARFSEDRTLRAIIDGCLQYVIVGAGLDTWALRTTNVLPEVKVFEIDQGAMQKWKKDIYLRNLWDVTQRLTWIASDLSHEDIIDVLRRNSVDLLKPIIVSMLGVLVYLDPSSVRSLFTSLKALPNNSVVIFDYRLDDSMLPPMEKAMMEFTARMMAAGGEPWLSSSSPCSMRDLLEASGFEIEEDICNMEMNERYLSYRRDGLQIAGGGFRYISARKVK